MATQPRLVNKQFNSPIGLYSQQNIQDVLDREAQILANGAVGINFQNPDVGKPANLKNSAVLRMLEEEENRQRNGIGPGAKRVAWPPPSETGSDSPYVEQNAVSAQQGGPQYSSQSPGLQQNNYQAPAPQRSVSSNLPLKPLDVSTGTSSPLSSPLLNQSPQGFRPATPAKGWAPVQSPVATPSPPSWQQPAPQQQYQPPQQQYQPPQQQYQPPQPAQQQNQPPQQYQRSLSSSSAASWQSGPQQHHTSSTRYHSAHHSVSQQTYLGQQYLPSGQVQYQIPLQQSQPPQQQYQPPQPQYQPPQQQYQPPQQQYQPPQQQYQPPQQQYQPPQQQYQPPQQQYQAPSAQQQYQASSAQQQYQSAQQQNQAPSQQQYQASAQQQFQPSPQQQYQAAVQQTQASPQTLQSAPKPAAAPSQVAPRAPAPTSKPAQPPPPSTITLRPNAPVSQAPPPVVTSQPATATLKVSPKNLRGDLKWPPEDVKKKIADGDEYSNDSFLSIQGGKHLRGDLKWPPENVRQLMAEEQRLLEELAKGPAIKPKRPNKDYSEFFEQHALNSTYPGYKIPPGTQFYRPE